MLSWWKQIFGLFTFALLLSGAHGIIGGRPAVAGQWPWMAALGYNQTNQQGTSFKCGGVLISNKHVLTAAICFTEIGKMKLSVVRLGDINLVDGVQDNATPVDIAVDHVTPHPQHSPTSLNYNIAIITLKQPVEFTKNIKPIALPTSSKVKSKIGHIMGWGSTEWRGKLSDTLLSVQVDLIDANKCKEKYNKETQVTIDDRSICAGGVGKDACMGDSGGPLVVQEGNNFYVAGIVSFGKQCGTEYPGVYVNVGSFLDWINANIK